ncbi:MAG: MFS transporter [Caldilineaceae bacterium]|nr:MFS transporter [Caldilineaceae bacterium]
MSKNRKLVVAAIISASLAVMISSGIRSSFGLFLTPITETLGTGRENLSIAFAVNNLVFGLPLVGLLSDRFGSRQVVIAGSVLYAGGLVMVTLLTTTMGLVVSFGLLVGIGLGATSYVVVLGAVAQLIGEDQRSRVFGLITAMGSAGMFVVPPLAQLLLSNLGWQGALYTLAAVPAIVALLAFGLPRRPGTQLLGAQEPQVEEPFRTVLRRAARHRGYLLLTTGFFVCGFHVAFIGAHLPAYLGDKGLPEFVAAGALALVGAFNILGSMLFGWLGDRYSRKYMLSLIYLGRAIVILIFLLTPLTPTSALVFGGAMGFLWLATVPLTSGTVAYFFGARYLSTLYGIAFFSHQIGAFIGVWLGGRFYDTTGSYTPIWIAGIALGLFAALIHLPIPERTELSSVAAAAD